MTHVETIMQAFTTVGYTFVVREDEDCKVLFLCNKNNKSYFEKSNIDILISNPVNKFFEFDSDGNWRSY